jgi:hypothetical protein
MSMNSPDEPFEEALTILQELEKVVTEGGKDLVVDLIGLIYQDWSQQERITGLEGQASKHFDEARRHFDRISTDYPMRAARLAALSV